MLQVQWSLLFLVHELTVSRLAQDDFVMAREREDGRVYFVGGLLAMPGFYLMSEKLGMSLAELHDPVPYVSLSFLQTTTSSTTHCRLHSSMRSYSSPSSGISSAFPHTSHSSGRLGRLPTTGTCSGMRSPTSDRMSPSTRELRRRTCGCGWTRRRSGSCRVRAGSCSGCIR
jgi:hypothetical protein